MLTETCYTVEANSVISLTKQTLISNTTSCQHVLWFISHIITNMKLTTFVRILCASCSNFPLSWNLKWRLPLAEPLLLWQQTTSRIRMTKQPPAAVTTAWFLSCQCTQLLEDLCDYTSTNTNCYQKWHLVHLATWKFSWNFASVKQFLTTQPQYTACPVVCFILLTRMWADAQHDGRSAEYRWRPLFNAAKFG